MSPALLGGVACCGYRIRLFVLGGPSRNDCRRWDAINPVAKQEVESVLSGEEWLLGGLDDPGQRGATKERLYLSLLKRIPHHSRAGKLRMKLLRAAVTGTHMEELRAALEDTPMGDEEEISWDSEAHSYSVVHVCAALGRVQEMGAVLEAWAQRRRGAAADCEAVRWLVDAAGAMQRTPLMEAALGGHAAAAERLAGRWRADAAPRGRYGCHEGTALHMCARLGHLACGEVEGPAEVEAQVPA
ncbi:hypothetical protein Pelo_2344 [Pelomyxa schiedti]|nr:hypothetical protein Pelo_2344 [Pelomyxa schiedti]